jgi:threonine dehydratase
VRVTYLAANDVGFVTLEEIQAAARSLPPVVRRTPMWPCALEPSEIGSERLYLKLESLQPTGSYKVRAAFTACEALKPDERVRGIVFASSGNFAQAFALAGRHHGIRTCAVMLASTSLYKVEATRALRADVDLFDGPALELQSRVDAIGRDRGMTTVNAKESRSIIAGHGTLGVEIVQDFPDVEQVLVPVSSGGLAAGVAAAIKRVNQSVKVIGVQPRNANAAYLSMAAGKLVSIDNWDSIADALSSRRPGSLPFAHLQQYLDEIVLVDEEDIAVAHMMMRSRAKVISEPAGAVSVAAYLSGRVDNGRKTVAIVSGGNLTDETMHVMDRMAKSVAQSGPLRSDCALKI